MRVIPPALHSAGCLGMLLAAATLSAQVKTDHDETFDFSRIKTYAIAIGTSWGNPIAERRVMASLDSVFQSKGWSKAANPDSADAAVVVHGVVGKKLDLRGYYTSTGFGAYRWGRSGTVSTEVREYPYGAIIVDVFDLKSKTMVFRGSAEGELSDKQQENQKRLLKAWKKMFKDFPPGRARTG